MRKTPWLVLLVLLIAPSRGSAEDAYVDIGSLLAPPVKTHTFPVGTLTGGATCTSTVAGCTALVVVAGPDAHLLPTAACIDDALIPATDDARSWVAATLALTCGTVPIVVHWSRSATIEITRTDSALNVGTNPIDRAAELVGYDRARRAWSRITSHQPSALQARPVVFYRSAATADWQIAGVSGVAGAGGGGGSGGGGGLNRICGAPDAERFCARELAQVRQGACFVETSRDDLQLIQVSPESHVIRANNSFRVVACIESDHTLRGTLSGTVGLTDPVIDNQTGGGTATGTPAPPGTPAPTQYRRVRLSFAPRQPGGGIDLAVRLRDRSGQQRDELETELVVEQTYAGALRLGVGIPLLAVDRAYSPERIAGSTQPEIVATGSDADVELVVAFAGFLEALYGGRSYTRPESDFFEHWGLFVAAGVLSSSQRGAQFMTSFYIGIELEPIRSLSLGFGFVLRRVNRLMDGYAVGDAVMDGATLSAERWEPGIGFVIGVSPEFLQFAGAIRSGG